MWSLSRKHLAGHAARQCAVGTPVVRPGAVSVRKAQRHSGNSGGSTHYMATQAKARSDSTTALLEQVQKNTNKYLSYITSLKLPEPSYEQGHGLPWDHVVPAEVEEARNAAIEGCEELQQLLMGPLRLVIECMGNYWLAVSLQYILQQGIVEHVPEQGDITFEALAQASGADVSDMTRFMRMAIACHVFQEPVKGTVRHTAASRVLANSMIEAWVLNSVIEFLPSAARAADAALKWPGSEEPGQSGYSLGHDTVGINPFDHIKQDPARQSRFNAAMVFSQTEPGFSVQHLLDGYDFASVRTMVDVGGSGGRLAVQVAERFPSIESIVVQDLPEIIKSFDSFVPSQLRSRIKPMAHDFFQNQPVHGADVYLLRWILHDWSDKYCIKILRALIPGLKKGAKVVISDICIPEPGQLSVRNERVMRMIDMTMKAFNNARERDAETWANLFANADSRFRFKGISVPGSSRMAIVEAEWLGDN